ncbi:MAG: bifunctional 2-polyprenyl-6-hydroxyphenol methylase/3-demethylubiquinol 3-O-methyltransferase UbiG [Rhizomicrobium sp.]
MTRAQRRSSVPSLPPPSSIDAREVAQFAALAQEWWDPEGRFAPLHRLNPLRLSFVRDLAARHFDRDPVLLRPFSELSLLDVGCGGGLLAEPVARQGFSVLGIDAAEDGIAAAVAHAAETELRPAYRCATAEALEAEGASFDVVIAMEIVEHVADRAVFLRACAALVKPGGLLFVATIARTLKALALAKFGAEYVLGWVPAGTHDWRKFVSPGALSIEIEGCGLEVFAVQGVAFDPLAWDWRLSADTDVNYMLAARK